MTLPYVPDASLISSCIHRCSESSFLVYSYGGLCPRGPTLGILASVPSASNTSKPPTFPVHHLACCDVSENIFVPSLIIELSFAFFMSKV